MGGAGAGAVAIQYDLIMRTWRQLCKKKMEVATCDSKPFIVCPPGHSWAKCGKLEVQGLLIRKAYEDLFRLWSAPDSDTHFIGGSSGVGKSMFIWYVLYRLMEELRDAQEVKTFLWITQERDIYWFSSRGGCEKQRRIEYEDVDYLFIDIGAGFQLPPGFSSSSVFYKKLLVTVSFKGEREGLDRLADCGIRSSCWRFMPVWSLEEIQATAARIHDDKQLDLSRLQALFLIFGGSARLCLENYPKSEPLDLSDTFTSRHSEYRGYAQTRQAYVDALRTSPRYEDQRELADVVAEMLMERRIVQLFTDVSPALSGPNNDFIRRQAASLLIHLFADPPHYDNLKTDIATHFCDIFLQYYMDYIDENTSWASSAMLTALTRSCVSTCPAIRW